MTVAGPERLNRYLARRGVASRRGADEIIAAGRVRVNGLPGVIGSLVEAGRDQVLVDGRSVDGAPVAVTIVLNKPASVITTVHDPEGRRTVMDLVEPAAGLVPVGRLDADSRGLLLLTTDGELAHRLTHPRHGVTKHYRVSLRDPASGGQLARLTEGVELDDGPARALRARRGRAARTIELVMGEGRKREVRRICAAVGLEVTDLVRTQIGSVRLGTLAEGTSRCLDGDEVEALRAAVGLGAVGLGECRAS